jgi:hypothetical protein
VSWRQERAEIRRLMAARQDPDGRHQLDTPEETAILAELDRLIRQQPWWRRARILYGD